jgi:hypothetical protein
MPIQLFVICQLTEQGLQNQSRVMSGIYFFLKKSTGSIILSTLTAHQTPTAKHVMTIHEEHEDILCSNICYFGLFKYSPNVNHALSDET